MTYVYDSSRYLVARNGSSCWRWCRLSHNNVENRPWAIVRSSIYLCKNRVIEECLTFMCHPSLLLTVAHRISIDVIPWSINHASRRKIGNRRSTQEEYQQWCLETFRNFRQRVACKLHDRGTFALRSLDFLSTQLGGIYLSRH